MPDSEPGLHLVVDLSTQRMTLREGGEVLKVYSVSTAANGPGEQQGSEGTPRGRHVIRAKIGSGKPSGTVFVGRRPTGEVWSPQLARRHPSRDWILTRILWLSGTEVGQNRLGSVDSMRRYIYIHGTPETEPMGVPASHGCIRMRNRDVIDLFDQVPTGTPVHILEAT
ncbi:MAG: L,D-transpeptidase [Gammaproteobacteria bacterium]|jgi:lipoprotein-anchoring transpeptidase ErfK/SrfK